MRLALKTGLAGALALGLIGCGGAQAERRLASAEGPTADLQVRRGEFLQRFLMTGELQAVRSDSILVPRNPSWQIQIRWMEADGSRVKAGQKVVELDNTALVSELDEKTLEVLKTHDDLAQKEAELAGQVEDKQFELEQKRVALEKAEIEAAVPETILERREHQERQLNLKRASNERDKAAEELRAFREASKAELEVLQIALDKAEREVEAAERAIDALILRAPRDGLLVVASNPREGRKFQVGDTAWIGLTVARLPDLSEMRIEAMLADVDDGRIKVGDSATCIMDAYPELEIPCQISEITPIAQEAGRRSLRRTFRVIVALDETHPDRMRPGMSVKLDVDAFRLPDTLLAPRAGLDLEVEPPLALLRDGDDREVQIGACNALECIVESGLLEGERLRYGG